MAEFSELGLLYHLIGLQKPHLKLRQLIKRAGKALQALKPCFMMGPLSVAQFLEPGAMKFDLIVMDEASQLKPEDALGAIARGSQVVIVGDRMQLPPTSFFDRVIDAGEEEEEEKTAIDVAESILEVSSKLYQPARMLKWHYRSRHESLIAFSNKEFYDNKLQIFPSPFPASDELGIKFVHVIDGVYQSRQNRVEANQIVDAIIEHLRNHPKDSLGVVAFNLEQAELIEELLSQRMKQDALAQQRMNEMEKSTEPFFIKNLENAQGDERDVVFISVNVSKSEAGSLALTAFGPLNNKSYGHRRLNVLITRAKKRVCIFSSIDPDEIKVGADNSWGVRALKGYLTYAKSGVLGQAVISGREPDSDFEIFVADTLRKRGYELVAQVGVANYFIDLAIVHPKKAGAYILGIECDGAMYHSSRSARDRDRLRQAALEELGWNIHRIWSTDWFRNSEREADKVAARINELLRRESGSL